MATTTTETHQRRRQREHELVSYRERLLDLKSETSLNRYEMIGYVSQYDRNDLEWIGI